MFQSAVQIHEISCIEDIIYTYISRIYGLIRHHIHIYTYISRIYGLIMDPHNDLLPVGPYNRDFKIVHDGRLGRLDECHVTPNPRDS